MSVNIYDDLAERGLIAQSTDERIRDRLATPLTLYAGFDPTADSLHVGHLIPLLVLARFQRAGHRPLALVGGATGLIGDPSGKTESRRLLTRDDIRANVAALGAQIGRIVDLGHGPGGGRLLDNAEWLADRLWLDVLRDWGPHFSVNRMLTMDSVRGRLESGGISFLEFNYMVMQAADFAHLAQTEGCSLQIGGQEQWGNIVMGIELARRLHGAELAGLTMPLLLKADGTKFGKSEGGAVWLDAARTPVWQFFQFWRDCADADVAMLLHRFTWLDPGEVESLTAVGGQALNAAKERLAFEVTRLVHGSEAAEAALESARRAHGEGDVSGDTVPHATLDRADLESGIGLLTLLVRAGLARSNGEARRLVQGGGVRLHDERIEDPQRAVTPADLVEERVVVRVGKKKLFRFDLRR